MSTKIYLLENLGCAHCAAKMEEKINDLSGIMEATITFATKQLRVTAEDPDSYLEEIRTICSSIESQVQVVPRDFKAKESCLEKQETVHKKELGDLPVIAAGAFLFVAGNILVRRNGMEMISLVIFVAAYLILGGKILQEAARNILHGQIFDENFLMCVATIGAFVIQEYPEAVGVMLFYRIGEYFEEKAVERSRSQIMEAVDMRPETVSVMVGEEVVEIAAEDAKIGDVLLIRPGDRIPLDGCVVSGESRIDTSPITGEPVPVAVRAGSKLTSGCVNTSGQLMMHVEKPLSESMVTRILDSVENAAASKPKLDRFITRFAKVYTPIVILLAAATAILPSVVTGDWNYWVYTALTFLVMSCPCALVLSVPLAFFSGIGAGSKKGILFKGGASLEFLSKVGAVIMDKTGTVTEGNFQVQKIVPVWKYSEEELLRICAGCEQRSTHPIAESIVRAAHERSLSLDRPVMLKEIAGCGVSAFLPQGRVYCGNKKLLEENGITVSVDEDTFTGSVVFVGVDGRFAGYFVISDTIKKDAESAMTHLKEMGLGTVMLTGDEKTSAEAVAKGVGIERVYAKLLPQEKLETLQKLRNEYGSVMYVGDGINDAPVLAGADVGAAMGSGADAAIEAADAVFMTSSVESIPEAIRIAKGTNRIAVQNVVFALAVKVAVMILGLLGHANMWMAVFADTGVAMICVMNSIRVLYRK